ncbi:hypothetical protein AVEN_27030-1 [Araneus ventricosus]|uniref:Uncharacterized protein n=1 Tax=Araneus ventricosus TaxID=182803 RepID=A0A4Y2QUB4_ARAVE|nr:hypothetical protein AVEN_27030-1 [Araneus ventricosus]
MTSREPVLSQIRQPNQQAIHLPGRDHRLTNPRPPDLSGQKWSLIKARHKSFIRCRSPPIRRGRIRSGPRFITDRPAEGVSARKSRQNFLDYFRPHISRLTTPAAGNKLLRLPNKLVGVAAVNWPHNYAEEGQWI